MSNQNIENVKKDFNQVKEYWSSLDPKVRFLDKVAVVQVLIFGIIFIYASIAKITPIVSNSAMMIFPLIMAGFTFVYRSKIHENKGEPNSDALKEYLMFFIIIFVLIVFSFVYATFF